MRIVLYIPRMVGPSVRPSLCSCAEQIGTTHALRGEMVLVDGVSTDRPEKDAGSIICEVRYGDLSTVRASYLFPRELAESLSKIANRHVLVIGPEGSVHADSKNLLDLSVQRAG